jgi:hypothetical protein
MSSMKYPQVKPYAIFLVLAALLSACAGPTENAGSPNANAPQQANSNSSPQPQVAQSIDPSAPPLTVQPMPPPVPKAGGDTTKAAEKSANGSAPTPDGRAPKLVAPDTKINFGKVPQEKTLIRAIAIRNAGKEDLKIESVAPS